MLRKFATKPDLRAGIIFVIYLHQTAKSHNLYDIWLSDVSKLSILSCFAFSSGYF